LESNRNLQQLNWKGGVEIFANNWTTNFMVQFNQVQNVFSLYHKAGYEKNNWSFSDYSVIDITNRALKQTGFLARHRQIVN
jgi:hypothetical protein